MVFEQSAISSFTMGACAPGLCTRLNPAAHGLLVRTEAVGDLPDGKALPTKVARLDYAAVIDLHATSVGATGPARALACGFADVTRNRPHGPGAVLRAAESNRAHVAAVGAGG